MHHRPALIIATLATAAALAGCGSSPPPQITVHGTVIVDNLLDGQPVKDGSQVTVTDPSGKVLGFTTLTNGEPTPETVTYQFTVKVQDGEQSYGVSVAGLTGTDHFTEDQMKQGPALCGGNACNGQGPA